MDNSVTRISDLPIDNAALSQKPLQTSPTTYTTINPHPNPYGHPPPSVPAIPTPEFQGNGGGGICLIKLDEAGNNVNQNPSTHVEQLQNVLLL
jgi:hypothetical protein